MNWKNVVARWRASGFSETCAQSGSILYVYLKMLIVRMTLFVKTVVRMLMVQSLKFKNWYFSSPFVMYLQFFVTDPLQVISLAWLFAMKFSQHFKNNLASTFFYQNRIKKMLYPNTNTKWKQSPNFALILNQKLKFRSE